MMPDILKLEEGVVIGRTANLVNSVDWALDLQAGSLGLSPATDIFSTHIFIIKTEIYEIVSSE